MAGLFSFLFLVSFVALVAGLVKPDKVVPGEEKSRTKALKYFGVPALVFAILTGAVSASSNAGDKTTVSVSSRPGKAVEKPVKPQEAKPTKTQAKKFDWKTAEVTKATVKQALKSEKGPEVIEYDIDYPKNITKVEVYDNAVKPGKKNVFVYYRAGTVWDETDMVERAGGTALKVFGVLYKNPAVEDAVVFASTKMTDEYGNTQEENVVKITFTREIASKVNWDGLAKRHASDPGNVYRIAQNYYIHPGILREVDFSKVKLY